MTKLQYTYGGHYVFSDLSKKYVPPLRNPTPESLTDFLEQFRSSDGIAVLEILDPPEVGPQQLTLYSDGGCYLLLLGQLEEDGEYEVRTLHVGSERGLRIVLGEPFPECGVTDDFQLVKQAFTELLLTGDVSRELMW